MRDRLTGDFGTGYSYWPSIWGAVVPILRSLTGGMTFSPKESVSFSFFCVSWLYHLRKQNTIHIWNTNLQKTNIPGYIFSFHTAKPGTAWALRLLWNPAFRSRSAKNASVKVYCHFVPL